MNPRFVPAMSVFLAVLLSACQAASDAAPAGAVPETPSAVAASASEAPPPDPDDPCRLLEPAEVEAALGAPLDGPPFRAERGAPTADGDACWYETARFANVAIRLTREGGGQYMAGVGGWTAKAEDGSAITLQGRSELTGEWDEVRVLGCCDFMALRGDSVVEIDYGGSALTEAQAAELVNRALLRLDQPLAIDGRAGVDAALARQARRPAPRPTCDVFSAADLGATVGELAGTEESSSDCTYLIAGAHGRQHMLVAEVTWRDGYREHREMSHLLAGMLRDVDPEIDDAASQAAAAAEMAQFQRELGEAGPALEVLGLDLEDLAADAATTAGAASRAAGKGSGSALVGPWDAAIESRAQLSAVRRDVQISVRQSGLPDAAVHALIGRTFDRYESEVGGNTP